MVVYLMVVQSRFGCDLLCTHLQCERPFFRRPNMLAKMPINGRRNGILAAYMIQSTAALVNFKIWGRKKTSDSQLCCQLQSVLI